MYNVYVHVYVYVNVNVNVNANVNVNVNVNVNLNVNAMQCNAMYVGKDVCVQRCMYVMWCDVILSYRILCDVI